MLHITVVLVVKWNDFHWLFIECSATSTQTGAKTNHGNYQVTLNLLAKVIKRFEFNVEFSLFVLISYWHILYISVLS